MFLSQQREAHLEPISTIVTLKLGAAFYGVGAGLMSGVVSRGLAHGFKNVGRWRQPTAKPVQKALPEASFGRGDDENLTWLVMRRRSARGMARNRRQITADLVHGQEKAFHALLHISGITPDEIVSYDLRFEKIRDPAVLCEYLHRLTGCQYEAGPCDPETQRSITAL